MGVYVGDEQVAAGTWTGSVIIVLTGTDDADTATLETTDTGTGEAGATTVEWTVETDKNGKYTITATVEVSGGTLDSNDKITATPGHGRADDFDIR